MHSAFIDIPTAKQNLFNALNNNKNFTPHFDTIEAALGTFQEKIDILMKSYACDFKDSPFVWDQPNSDGNTLLECGVRNRNYAFVEKLLEKTRIVDKVNYWERTPLDLAIQLNDERMVRILFSKNARKFDSTKFCESVCTLSPERQKIWMELLEKNNIKLIDHNNLIMANAIKCLNSNLMLFLDFHKISLLDLNFILNQIKELKKHHNLFTDVIKRWEILLRNFLNNRSSTTHPLIRAFSERSSLQPLTDICGLIQLKGRVTFIFKREFELSHLQNFLKLIDFRFDVNMKDGYDMSLKDLVRIPSEVKLLQQNGMKFSPNDIIKIIIEKDGMSIEWLDYIIQQNFSLHTIHPDTKQSFLMLAIKHCTLTHITKLLNSAPAEIEHKEKDNRWDHTNKDGESALDLAIQQSNSDTIDMLLTRGARKFDFKLLCRKIRKFELPVQKTWLQIFQKHDALTPEIRKYFMHEAIQNHDPAFIRVLHTQGIELYSSQYLPVISQNKAGHPDISQNKADHPVNLDYAINNLFLYLNQAKLDEALTLLYQNQIKIIVFLTESNEKISFNFDFSNIEPLLKAAKQKKLDILKFTDSTGKSLKDYALEQFDKKLMESLIKLDVKFTKIEKNYILNKGLPPSEKPKSFSTYRSRFGFMIKANREVSYSHISHIKSRIDSPSESSTQPYHSFPTSNDEPRLEEKKSLKIGR